ncbi:MAG: L,D-transpeptidase [Thermoleophilia bacterium]|nr:L,D-transpeptidase [Thermoleophilia bacterium]
MKRAVTAVACLLLVPACAQAARTTGGPRIAPRQEIVTLLRAHGVRIRPRADSKRVAFVRARRPITGARTALPVLAQRIDDRGRFWLRVRLPGRVLRRKPPPRTGWITVSKTLRSTTVWHIVVDVSARRVAVYRGGRRLHRYRAIVGKPSTPTPRGKFFVEENVQMPADSPGAPFALPTSARSKVLQEFDGGPGQIALHGLDNIGGQLGTAVSHGCIRLANSAITWLAARIEPGVPVTIV